MTDFTREAARLLRATEDALYHRRPMTGLFDQVSQSPMRKRVGGADEDLEGVSNFPMQASWFSNAKGCRGGHVCDSAASITELERQLRIVMREVSDLRCELAAERETRSSALTALGRRWKEEVLLEVRASEYQSRRVIDNLVVSLEQQRQEDGTARSLLQQRVEDLLRDSKVRDRTHFDAQEQLREQVDAMRERLESAVSECALLRVECVQHQERENSAIAQRLDAELMRYVDIRAEDQRERQQLKHQVKTEVEALGAHVQELVDKTWKSHLITTQRELQEPIDKMVKQMASHTENIADLNARVHDCVTTCRAELRLQTTALQERVSAAESNVAVILSRVDRAERKSDSAQEASSRADATIAVVRDAAERAVATAQRAMATAQRAEDGMENRDARVSQLETQLTAVSTAEKLRADLEGVRRIAQRAESGVDSLRHVYERDVQEQDKEKRQSDAMLDRLTICERQYQSLRSVVDGVTETRMPQLQQRLVVLEDARETLVADAARGENAILQNQQRLSGIEGTVRSLVERLEQLRRDTNAGSQALSTRVEAANDAVLRCETTSATARGEVERIDRRVCQLEMQTTRLCADFTTLNSTTEDNTKDTQALSAQLQQQQRIWQEQRDPRRELEAAAAATAEAEAVAEQATGRLEVRLGQQIRRVETSIAERADKLEARMNEANSLLEKLRDDGNSMSSRVTQVGDTIQQQQQQLARDLQTCRTKVDALGSNLSAIDESLEQRCKDFVLQHDLNTVRRAVKALESELRTIGTDVAQHQQVAHLQEESNAKLRRLEEDHRRHQLSINEIKESLRGFHEELRETQHFAASLSNSRFGKGTGKADEWSPGKLAVEKSLFDSHQEDLLNESHIGVTSTPVRNIGAEEISVIHTAADVTANTSMRRFVPDSAQPSIDSPEPQKPSRQPQQPAVDTSMSSQSKRLLSPALPTTEDSSHGIKEEISVHSSSPVWKGSDEKSEPAPRAKVGHKRPANWSPTEYDSGSSSSPAAAGASPSGETQRSPTPAPHKSSSGTSSINTQRPHGLDDPGEHLPGEEALPMPAEHSHSSESVEPVTVIRDPATESVQTPTSAEKNVTLTAAATSEATEPETPFEREVRVEKEETEPTKKATTGRYDDWDDDTESNSAASAGAQLQKTVAGEEEDEEDFKEEIAVKQFKKEEDMEKDVSEEDVEYFDLEEASEKSRGEESVEKFVKCESGDEFQRKKAGEGATAEGVVKVPSREDSDLEFGTRAGRYVGRKAPMQILEDAEEDITFTVPRHGVLARSSSSSTKSKELAAPKQPVMKQFTSFDDSTSEEDG